MIYLKSWKLEHADAISRYPHEKVADDDTIKIEDKTVQIICSIVQVQIKRLIEIHPAAPIYHRGCYYMSRTTSGTNKATRDKEKPKKRFSVRKMDSCSYREEMSKKL